MSNRKGSSIPKAARPAESAPPRAVETPPPQSRNLELENAQLRQANQNLAERLDLLQQAVDCLPPHLCVRDQNRRLVPVRRAQAESLLKKNRDYTSAVLDSLAEHIAVLDQDGRIVLVNEAWRKFGRSNGAGHQLIDPLGVDYLQAFRGAVDDPDATASQALVGIEDVLAGRRPTYHLEYPCHSPDQQRWFEMNVSAIQGLQKGAVVSHVDITQRRYADAERLASEARLEQSFINSPIGMATVALDGRFKKVNPALCEMLGRTPEELLNDDFQAVTHLMDLPPDLQLLGDLLAGRRQSYQIEKRFIHKEGRPVWVLLDVSAVRDALGKPLHLMKQVRDISRRKLAEEALTASEARFRAIINASPVPMALNDNHQNITFLNPCFTQTFGYSREDIPTLADWWPKAYPDPVYRQHVSEQWAAEMERVGRTGDAFAAMEVTLQCKDGTRKTVLANGSPLSESLADDHLVVLYDITARKQAEEALRERDQRLEFLLTSSPASVYTCAVSGDFGATFISENVRNLTGHEPREYVEDSSFWISRIHPDDRARVLAGAAIALQQGQYGHEYRFQHRDGGYRWMHDQVRLLRDAAGRPTMMIGSWLDVTERRRMEELVLQSEKMMSIGGLAAGMAHEINNPLAAMVQNAQVVLRRVKPGLAANRAAALRAGTTIEAVQAYLADRGVTAMLAAIQNAGGRAAEIVSNMLSFAHPPATGMQRHSLPELIDAALDLVQIDLESGHKLAFRKAQVVRDYDKDLPQVVCQESEIKQVLVNLIQNSLAAAGAQPLRLIVRTRQTPDHAIIELEDNGEGIPADLQARIFEPFFTTKEPGRGTGLGLSISYFIITQRHLGRMRVDSAPGRGTRVELALPL